MVALRSDFRMVTSEEIAGVVDHVFDVRIQRNAETGALDLPLGCETIGREVGDRI